MRFKHALHTRKTVQPLYLMLDPVKRSTNISIYTVMQLERNSSKTDTFHGPTSYEPHI